MDRTQQLIDCLQRWDEEDQAGRPASASSVCGGHPDLVADLEALCEYRSRLERLLGSLDGLDTLVRVPGDVAPPPGLPAVPGYAVTALLAEGGMGQVYRAKHLKLGREVAIKVIRPDRVSAEYLARFQTEAEAVARLNDPNIVQIYEVGEYDEGGAKIPYLALEFVPGGTLEFRAGKYPLHPDEASRVVRVLARAVAHAHARGVVHRDLKPDNVLIAPPEGSMLLEAAMGRPKITDFGLARREAGDPSATRPGSVMGTPSYMAPEQAEGRPAGKPADVYALGAILFRLLTGRVVFPSDTWIIALHKVCTEPPRFPDELRGKIPPALEALCLRCLDKEAARRPKADELASELERLLSFDTLPPTEPYRTPAPRRPRRRVLAAVGVLALLLLAGLTGWKLWPLPKPVPDDFPKSRPAAVVPLRGVLDAEMRREGDRLRNQFIPLSDPAARPLRPRDEIRVSVELNSPAYIYILWIDTEGKVSPQYPWIDHDWTRRDAEVRAERFELPRFEGAWGAWRMGPGEPGLETMVLLCREEPLPATVDLEGILRGLGKVPLDGQDAGAISWFENGNTVRNEKQRAPLAKAVEGGNPLERVNREIHLRVKDHFDYTRTITYGNTGGK
jgi:serine/threonine protein kinase